MPRIRNIPKGELAISSVNGLVCLFVANETNDAEEKVKLFSQNKQRGQRIAKIYYANGPLPRTQTLSDVIDALMVELKKEE